MKKFIVFISLVLCVLSSMAQVQVEAKIDSIQILIGEQAHVTLSVTMQKGNRLETPMFKPSQYITPGVEVLEVSDADTAGIDDGMVRVSRVYTLTSFDENLYYLPPLNVKVNGKAYKTKSLALKVLTIPVDTLHPEQFFPPKDVQDNPFMWSEWQPLFLLSILLILVFGLTLYIAFRLRENKPIIVKMRIIKRVLPHQKAMREIEKIKTERMVTSENQKEYYTRLTDTLRKYIEERFGFNAMEMTSSEIIAKLQEVEDHKMTGELRELFMTADLVKFAKHSTLINENDANLVNAIDFINSTKIDNVPEKQEVVSNLTENDRRGMRSRMFMKWIIALGAVICLSIFVYIVYSAYQLL